MRTNKFRAFTAKKAAQKTWNEFIRVLFRVYPQVKMYYFRFS
jgi:predicted RecB family nuclease